MTTGTRVFPRVHLRTSLTFEVNGTRRHAYLHDISEGGIYAQTANPAERGTNLAVLFELEGQKVNAEGRVVHASPRGGMGLQFTGISDEDREVIRRVVVVNGEREMLAV